MNEERNPSPPRQGEERGRIEGKRTMDETDWMCGRELKGKRVR